MSTVKCMADPSKVDLREVLGVGRPHYRDPSSTTPTRNQLVVAPVVVACLSPVCVCMYALPGWARRSAPRSHQEAEPSRAQRDARSAYKIDRDAAGGVVDLVRLSGAKEHRFSRSDRPLCLAPPASFARRSAPSTGCGCRATGLLSPPLALALAPQASVGQLLRRRALRSAE